jgi:glycosyltransferase involved in cell wall biosynthesis
MYARCVPGEKRIVLVTNELLGLVRTGGAGTATTFLSFALAALGNDVELLFTDTSIAAALDPAWSRQYAARGIRIERLDAPGARIEPGGLALAYAVQQHLEHRRPDVIVANDWGGPAYAALKLRELGLGFENTLAVVYCHGTNGWAYDAQRKARRSVGSFELEALERASVELADVVVSPSAYMLDWMRRRGWAVPHAVVAPYFTHAAVEGGAPERVFVADRIRRVVFFGRLEERKGIAPFITAVNAIEPELLHDVEILFLGRETAPWPVARIRKAIAHAAVRFETRLDQPQALALLRTPGTLAVMPSLVDNSPNVVYECLENGIPFLAGGQGGGPELVDAGDRARTFVEPTADALGTALAELLTHPAKVRPARAAFSAEAIRSAWRDVVAASRPPQERARSDGDFVLVSDERDELDRNCRATLERAQASSGADIVTCGVRTQRGRREELRLFLGDPGALGVVANYYGAVGLYRRELLEQDDTPPGLDGDRDWARLARLSLAGARIVSVPAPLARTRRVPGTAADGGGAALDVVRTFERVCPPPLRALPRLAAGLAAQSARPDRAPTLRERITWIWEYEGLPGLLRRGRLHARRLPSASVLRRRPHADTQPRPAADRVHEREPEQENGRGEREPELARVAGRPRGLAEPVVRERDEPDE